MKLDRWMQGTLESFAKRECFECIPYEYNPAVTKLVKLGLVRVVYGTIYTRIGSDVEFMMHAVKKLGGEIEIDRDGTLDRFLIKSARLRKGDIARRTVSADDVVWFMTGEPQAPSKPAAIQFKEEYCHPFEEI